MKEAQKKKGPKKKDAEKEISLVATSDKGYAPLDLRRLAGGGLSWVQRKHTANKNFSGRGAVRTQRFNFFVKILTESVK